MIFSAVIPAYNAEKYIQKALDSLLNQTCKVQEIIVIDDGSTDSTCSLIEKYSQNELKLIRQVNAGVSAARNLGISHAQGEWILFLDADDECDMKLVETYQNYVSAATSEPDMIYTNVEQIDEDSIVIPGIFQGKALQGKQGFVDMLMRNPIISPSGCLLKKSSLMQMNGFDESMKYAEDVDLYLRMLYNDGHIAHIPETLTHIRRHTSNTTSNIAITTNGEKVLLQRYTLNCVKDAIFSSTKSHILKDIEYINFLIRYEHWQEASERSKHMVVSETSEYYVAYTFILMLIAIHNNQIEDIKKHCESILKVDDNHGAAINNLGCVYAIKKEYDLALLQFNKALELFPGYMDVQYNLAHLQEHNVNFRFTKRELRKNLLRYS